MSRMMAPSMEVVRFKEADVIVSSILGASGFGNNNRADSIFSLNGQNFTLSTFAEGQHGFPPFVQLLNDTYGTEYTTQTAQSIIFVDGSGTEKTFTQVYLKDNLENGTYYWDRTEQKFRKQ